MASPVGNPLPGHLEALTRIRLSVLRLLNIIKDLPTKEMGELANKFKDFKLPPKKKHEPANEVDKDIKEDEEQPFNEPSVLYDEVLGGLEDEVVILEAGEDDNLWLNNAESRHLSYSINLVKRRALELKRPILN
ncbi:hypothetical protein V2W45_1474747 [Cenococcum geophilum]